MDIEISYCQFTYQYCEVFGLSALCTIYTRISRIPEYTLWTRLVRTHALHNRAICFWRQDMEVGGLELRLQFGFELCHWRVSTLPF